MSKSYYTKAKTDKKNTTASIRKKSDRSSSVFQKTSVSNILFLQSAMGNQTMKRLLGSNIPQAKLRIGPPKDSYEEEADRVAESVVRMPNSAIQPKPTWSSTTSSYGAMTTFQSEQALIVRRDMETHINDSRGGGRPLPASALNFFESRFGYDFGQVRVHVDAEGDLLNQALNARAFTFGQDIFLRRDEYNTNTETGRILLAHELTHVIQQSGRSVERLWSSGVQVAKGLMPPIIYMNSPRVQKEVAARIPNNSREALGQATISELFDLYASESEEFTIASVGATYTRDWVRGPEATALIRGHIRAKLADYLHEPLQRFDGMRQWFLEIIERIRGTADRLTELQTLVNEAFDRIGEVGLAEARRTAPILMDEGRQGSTFSVRETRASQRARRADPSLRPVTLMHAAMDAPAPAGTGVYTPIAGRVIFASPRPGYGNIVRVLHETPPATTAAGSGPVVTSYAHLNEILVAVGEELRPGQAVGTVGNTRQGPGGSVGRVTIPMGEHLHFSVQRVAPGRVPLQLSSAFERDPALRVRPDSWLCELGVYLAPGVAVEDRSPAAHRATAAATVQPKRQAIASNPSANTIQRELFDDSDPVERLRRGMTLPYREATQILDCINRMGVQESDFCYRTVLGIPAPERQPGADTPALTSGPSPPTAAPHARPAACLNVTAPGVVLLSTPSGNFYRFPASNHHHNYSNRPRFQHPATVMVVYSGAGANGTARVHPAVVSALNTLMTAMHAEGHRIDDESLKQARVTSAYRSPTLSEGNLYLAALRRTISHNPSIFGSLTFPASLESMARSELGFTGSPTHRAFQAAVAAQPGWSGTLARQLIQITAQFKAPRGGSTHHSGVVVDIDFPYAINSTTVRWHGFNRSNNSDAFRSAAGVWLSTHASTFHFDTYNTDREIWHQEWRNWPGTSADPSVSAATSP